MPDNCEKSGIGNLIRELEQEHDTVIDADTARRLQAWRGLADFLKELPGEVAETIRGEDTAEEIADDEVVMRSISGKGATKKELEEAAERSEEMSENSTDKDFEDYFAANAPVDALSKMEKAVQLLETIDTEELRRTEQAMVSSALKSLRHSLQRWHSFRDEDTVGDDSYGDRVSSEGEKRDTCGNGRCNGGPSPAASENTLEPAAWLVEKVDPAWSDNVQSTELVEKFTYVPAHERGDKEPLVRLSTVEEWYADILYQLSFLSNQMPDGAQEYLQRKRRGLREFTQGGPSE